MKLYRLKKLLGIIGAMSLIGGIVLMPFRFLNAVEYRVPIIIVPGVGASMNWQLMTGHGADEWGFAPTVKDYDGLIQTFVAKGYTLNLNLFVAHYDWRQSNILSATQYLKTTIDTAVRASGINAVRIIAHSMGGLVTRAYLEYTNDTRVSTFIMLGTPNSGSSDPYVLWENGTIPDAFKGGRRAILWWYLWYLTSAQKLFGNQFNSVQQYVPSTRELLPTYDYLQNATTNQIVPYAEHSRNANTLSRNTFLEQLNRTSNIQQMINQVFETHIIAGNGKSTLKYIPIATDTNPDPQWTDGIPQPNPPAKDSTAGDGTVLLESAFIRNIDISQRIFLVHNWWQRAVAWLGIQSAHAQEINPLCEGVTEQWECDYYTDPDYPIQHHIINAEHSELPTKAIPEIFQILGLGTPPTLPAQPNPVQRLLQFWVGSPVSIQVIAPDGASLNQIPNAETFSSGGDDPIQIVSIPEPQQGHYQITLTGTGSGEYHLATSLISDTEQTVQTVEGTTTQNQTNQYQVNIPKQPTEPRTEDEESQLQLFGAEQPTIEPINYAIQLTKGWNLISIPTQPTSATINDVFGITTQNIESIWTYDTGEWLVYTPNSPETSSFNSISPGYGYFVNYNGDSSAMIQGSGMLITEGPNAPPSRTLAPGWNLVGQYQIFNTPQTATQTFTNLAYKNQKQWHSVITIDPITKMYQRISDSDTITPGAGYWIFLSSGRQQYIYSPIISP